MAKSVQRQEHVSADGGNSYTVSPRVTADIYNAILSIAQSRDMRSQKAISMSDIAREALAVYVALYEANLLEPLCNYSAENRTELSTTIIEAITGKMEIGPQQPKLL